MNADIGFSDIQKAAERIRGIAHRTPVLTSKSFDALAGVNVFFKCENFQRGGAFKIRGASNFVYSIPKDQLSRGVVTYSSANHAPAVAIAGASRRILAPVRITARPPHAES